VESIFWHRFCPGIVSIVVPLSGLTTYPPPFLFASPLLFFLFDVDVLFFCPTERGKDFPIAGTAPEWSSIPEATPPPPIISRLSLFPFDYAWSPPRIPGPWDGAPTLLMFPPPFCMPPGCETRLPRHNFFVKGPFSAPKFPPSVMVLSLHAFSPFLPSPVFPPGFLADQISRPIFLNPNLIHASFPVLQGPARLVPQPSLSPFPFSNPISPLVTYFVKLLTSDHFLQVLNEFPLTPLFFFTP